MAGEFKTYADFPKFRKAVASKIRYVHVPRYRNSLMRSIRQAERTNTFAPLPQEPTCGEQCLTAIPRRNWCALLALGYCLIFGHTIRVG